MRSRLLTAASVLWAVAAPSAFAQSAGPSADPQEPTTLEEIIVTGEKADRSLQDTTTSVAVTTGRKLEREGVISLQEVYNRTANMSETYGSAGFTIRGVATQGVSGGGDAPLATVYVDGAPMPTSILYNGPTDAWDVRQVEILRGPQSTLQGLNALAGAVIVRTQDPTPDWDLRARLTLADPQETGIAVAGGGPIIEDELSFRVAVERREGDGFAHNVTRNAPEAPIDRTTVRGKLLWTPAALPGFEARLGYTRFESEGGYQFVYVRTDVPNFYEDRIATNNARNGSNVSADLLNLEASYALNDRLTLTSATSWSDVSDFNEYDNDGGPQDISYGFAKRDYETLTQELRLNYEGDRLRGLLGAFYYNRDQTSGTASRTDVPTPVGTIAALLQSNGLPAATAQAVANMYVAALPVIPVNYAGVTPSEVQTYAVFGDGEWRFNDQLSVLGGFRWDHETNTVAVNQTATFAGVYPNPNAFGAPGSPLWTAVTGINAGVAALVAQAGSSTPESRREFDAFLPKLGVRYRWTEDLSTAFVVQRGYRSGGTSSNIARSQVYAYDPEYTWNYEASLRSTWLDGDLTVNANAYYVDWTDQQVTANFGLNLYDYHTVNAGKSHLYGAEIETTFQATDALGLYGSIGYSRTRFDEFKTDVGNAGDYTGTEFAYAPRWTLSVGGDYRWGNGFVANLNAGYRSAVWTESGTYQSSRVGDRTVVNGKIGYETERWGAYLYGKNLLDEEYMTYNRADWGQAVLGDPRVVGLMLQADW